MKDNNKWHHYPEEQPKYSGTVCWCKVKGGNKIRKLCFDYVYGWCWDWDEYDQPHTIIDWDLDWKEVDDDDEN